MLGLKSITSRLQVNIHVLRAEALSPRAWRSSRSASPELHEASSDDRDSRLAAASQQREDDAATPKPPHGKPTHVPVPVGQRVFCDDGIDLQHGEGKACQQRQPCTALLAAPRWFHPDDSPNGRPRLSWLLCPAGQHWAWEAFALVTMAIIVIIERERER
jgi:hypothetical protein